MGRRAHHHRRDARRGAAFRRESGFACFFVRRARVSKLPRGGERSEKRRAFFRQVQFKSSFKGCSRVPILSQGWGLRKASLFFLGERERVLFVHAQKSLVLVRTLSMKNAVAGEMRAARGGPDGRHGPRSRHQTRRPPHRPLRLARARRSPTRAEPRACCGERTGELKGGRVKERKR